MKTLAIPSIAFIVVFFGWSGLRSAGLDPVYAQNVKQKVLNSGSSKITVKVLTNAEVLDVKPYIKAKAGKKEGPLWLDVKIKNTSAEPKNYAVFGQGMTETGGWLGGMNKVPKKGKLDPGKETTTKIRTRYQGESVPREIRVEVFPPS